MKKTMAKAVMWIVTLMIMVMTFGVVSFAEGEATNYVLTASAASVNVGDSITVNISCKDMTVSSFTGGFRFDTSRFEVTAISDDEGGNFTALSSVEEANAAGAVGFAKTGFSESLVTARSLVTATLRAKAGGNTSLTLYEDGVGTNGKKNQSAQTIGIEINIVKDKFPDVSYDYEGLAQAVDTGIWYYLKKGKEINKKATGLYYHRATDIWFYVQKGIVDETYNGVQNNENGWWKITNGRVDFGFTGFERNEFGWWYLENGWVSFDKNDLISGMANTDPSKAGEYARWLVRGSRVENATTVANSADGWWYVKNGKVDDTYTGVAQNENGWWKITEGKVVFDFKGFERNEHGWWYLEGGKVSFDKNDLISGKANTDPSKEGVSGRWLVRNSRVENATTVANSADGWWYVKNGKVDKTYTGVAQNENGWWKITNGRVDFGFTGFERNENGWWYLENGKVNFNRNDLIYGKANTDPSKKGETAWWLVRGSRVENANIVANNAYGWWAVRNGKVDFSYTGVANNENGWWAIVNGGVRFDYYGFLPNENGWWYLENGRVNFNKNDLIYGKANTDPSKKGETAWWLVRGSRVENANIVANNAYGWWAVRNGKVDFSYTGVANNENGWWAIVNGGVRFDYYGFLPNENGWWYLENGKVNFNKNDVIYGKANTDPSKKGETAWWLVRGSHVENANTVANNANGWWYIKGGKVDFGYTGVAENENGWWRIEDGRVNFGFTGLASNEYGLWYLKNGKVDFSYNGTYNGRKIVNGEAV